MTLGVKKKVWVEQTGGQVIRIFKSKTQAFSLCPDPVELPKSEAVGSIRRHVYDKQLGRCLACNKEVPYEGELWKRAHMDEVIAKGKGGDVSITNCQILCPACHWDKHSDRRPRFGKEFNK